MKAILNVVIWAAFAAFAAVPTFASPPSVNAEKMDLEVDMEAKVGMAKARKGTGISDGMKNSRNSNGKSSDCGTVNIASNNSKPSNSGIKDMIGKTQTTIVTGPVINMANCK